MNRSTDKCKVKPFFFFFQLYSKVNRMEELLSISRRSPAEEFAFKLCLLTSLILDDVQDALLIAFRSPFGKQLQATEQDGDGGLFYVALNCCFF